ncbi:hypothetical protein BGX34_001082 [Mortierella sp. NVP85]|nr:hypothetical protein BGX34_001082 [Mortierella sp. NVP85]
MLRATTIDNNLPDTQPMAAESTYTTLAKIWPEFDPDGLGVQAPMMEEILRRLEEELGTSLLVENSWNELRAYVKCITGTVVSQKDLRDLLDLLRKSAQQAQEALEAQASEPVAETSLSEDQEPFPESETDDRYNNSNGVDMESEPISGSHLHPRHQSSVYPRPRGTSIRKISLSESSSSQYRPYHSHSRVSHGPSEDELDGSEYRVSFSRDGSHDESRSRNSASPSDPSIRSGDPQPWTEGSYNHLSLREQSRTEYEGYGLEFSEMDSRVDSPETVHRNYKALERKLQETEHELNRRDLAFEAERASLNPQETERLKRQVRDLHRQIEQSNSQISEMSKQMVDSERLNSTQKTNAVALRKQKDELEKENALIREDLRRKEDELNHRLESDAAAKRKIKDGLEENNRLREQLAQQIAEKEEITRALDMVKHLRLAELVELDVNGSDGAENSGSMAYSLGLDVDVSIQGKNLMSELANVDPRFGADPNDQSGYDSTSDLQRASRLMKEGEALTSRLKRSSMMGLSQRYKESMEMAHDGETKEPAPMTSSSTANLEGSSTFAAVIIRSKVEDDVDCELPQGLQTLEAKEELLDVNLEAQDRLIESLLQHAQSGNSFDASGGVVEGGALPSAAIAILQRESGRARRRKPQASRALSPQDLANLLNPGANVSSSTAMSKKDTKTTIANVTLVSVYTIFIYLLGLVTSVFMVDNQSGAFSHGRYLSYAAAANDVNGGNTRFGVIEVLVYWIQNLVWQGDAAHVPT